MKRLLMAMMCAAGAFAGLADDWHTTNIWNGVIRDDYPSAGQSYAIAAPNSTNYCGGDGAMYPNGQDRFIELQAGSTLIVTQTLAKTMWAGIIATNGAATLIFQDNSGNVANGNFSSHVFCGRDTGSLTVIVDGDLNMGHETKWPVADLKNLRVEHADGSVANVALTSVSLYSLPAEATMRVRTVCASGYILRLAGATEVYDQEDTVTVRAKTTLEILNQTAIPPTKPIVVPSGAKLNLLNITVPYDIENPLAFPETMFGSFTAHESAAPLVVSNPITLEAGGLLTFTNLTQAATYAGTLTGAGDVLIAGHKQAAYSSATPLVARLSGDNSGFTGTIRSADRPATTLYLDHAKAAANATIDTTKTLTVKVGADIAEAEVGALQGGDTLACVFDIDEGKKISVKDSRGCNCKSRGKGEFAVTVAPLNWQARVSSWFDFSNDTTWKKLGESTLPGEDQGLGRNKDDKDGGSYSVEHVLDWRDAASTVTLWNRRAYAASEGRDQEFYVQCYPTRKTDETLGKAYLAFSKTQTSRRLPFNDVTGGGGAYNNRVPITPALVVMVFGSQLGGGMALLATEDGAFKRTEDYATTTTYPTLDTPIALSDAHDMWVDGEKITPSTSHFSGGWQVISIDTRGLEVGGLGFVKDTKTFARIGGQNYGELIVFTDMPTEYERREAEEYLAAKWQLTSQYKPGIGSARAAYAASFTNTVSAVGAGQIASDDATLEVKSAFRGTVTLGGGKLVVKAAKKPYTAAQIPQDGLEFWIDPDDSSKVYKSGIQVYGLADKSGKKTDTYFSSNKTRGPWAVDEARGDGPTHTWINFESDKEGNGRTMRTTDSFSSLGNAKKFPIQTAFYVMDSVNGGGSPLLDAIQGGTNLKSRGAAVASGPLWASGSSSYVTKGTNRLNGVSVACANGFTGGPEVFSFAWQRVLEPSAQWFLDDYSATNGENKRKSLVMGETLYYSTALSEADTQGIEAYLMNKWLGCLPEGFSALTEMTVAGNGTVEVQAGADMPIIADAFSGTVSGVTETAYTASVSAQGEVTGSLIKPNATYDLPASCSLAVTFAALPKSANVRVFKVVDLAGVTSPVTWNVTVSGLDSKRYTVAQSADGACVEVTVKPSGLIMIYR